MKTCSVRITEPIRRFRVATTAFLAEGWSTSRTHRHSIRPVLFAFYEWGHAELKMFVEENPDICVWDKGLNEYMEWLRQLPGNDVPNHLKLYWWILIFWKRLPQMG